MRSIDERNRSLLKVTRAVVEVQHEFFRRGPKYLAPLTLKDVAAEVGVHEATVSRLANGKYVQTELGIFELRYFFTNSISGAGSKGSRYSKTGVKEMVREIVTDAGTTNGAAGKPLSDSHKPLSDSHKPLSDSRIAEILAEKGVKIARRTVAKYRKELDIDSSYRRT
jgi:RNA polymerase sigma-54 factor